MNTHDQTAEFLQSLLAADDAAKAAALRALRGESPLPASANGPLLYTVTQTARRWNCSRSTVWRAIRAGKIRKIELYPGCERLRRADVEALARGES